jgi:hypothetical protein
MKRLKLLFCFIICALLGASVFSEIYNDIVAEAIVESGQPEVNEPERTTELTAQADTEKVFAESDDILSEIANLSAEIENLQDKNFEPVLQRQIEQLKLEYEVFRINIALAKAQELGDSKLAQEYSAELEHLSRVDESVVGNENEQPMP